MSYTLYWAADTGALGVELALEKCGANFQRVNVDTSEFTPEFEALNPMKQVPVLILPDGTKLTESAAMILQLNEDFPGKLFPEKGPARATAFRWLLFMAVNLYETVLRYDYSGRFTTLQTPEALEGIKEAANIRMKLLWKIVERDAFLEGGPYLLGKEPWAVDFYLWMLTNWLGEMREEILKECPKIANMHKLIRENPIVVKVHDLHYPPSGK